MILAIGLIMAAAIFPVSVQQASTAADESVSAAVAWNAIALIQEKFRSEDLPVASRVYKAGLQKSGGAVRSFRDPQSLGSPTLLKGFDTGRMETVDPAKGTQKPITFAQPVDYAWNQVKGEAVVADDPRYAWVAFYRRQYHISGGDHADSRSWAQVLVIVARARESSAFGQPDVSGRDRVNLQPRPVTFKLTSDGKGAVIDQVVELKGGDVGAAAEGAFLVVADDGLPADGTGGESGAMNGQVFRLGNHVEGDVWELQPGNDFSGARPPGDIPDGFDAAEGFLIGRTAGASGFEGLAQDVSAYTMIIPLP